MNRLIKFIKTNENWCGAYPPLEFGNPFEVPAVKVIAVKLLRDGWRVAVWGDDDFGMERDGFTQPDAKEMFDSIKDYTTQNDLKKMGFIPA